MILVSMACWVALWYCGLHGGVLVASGSFMSRELSEAAVYPAGTPQHHARLRVQSTRLPGNIQEQ